MRACLQCVACFIYFATITQVILILATIIEAGSMGGLLVIFFCTLFWLAASLEIYSIYVRNETADKKKKKKNLTQREDGIWTRCHEPATPVLARRYHTLPTPAWLFLLAMSPLGFKSSAIVPEREMLWEIPKDN